MPQCLLVYSSVTGNTRMVAEAIRRVLPEDTAFFPVQKAPSADDFDFVAIGFWVHRGGPDPIASRYMETVRNRDVAFFGTLAAYPDSEHASQVIASAENLLVGNRILGSFLCQGKLAKKPHHPMTEERRIRLLEAERHPDKHDLELAANTFSDFWKRHQAE